METHPRYVDFSGGRFLSSLSTFQITLTQFWTIRNTRIIFRVFLPKAANIELMTAINCNKSLFFKSVISSTLVLSCDASSGCWEGLEFLAFCLVEISTSKPFEMSSPLSSVSWTQPSKLVKPLRANKYQSVSKTIYVVTLHLVTNQLKNVDIFSCSRCW